jgi:phage shock protein PspC (stress-responsive transcriptional regulator)
MDKLVRKYGNWAFIAGAAEGIGEAYPLSVHLLI